MWVLKITWFRNFFVQNKFWSRTNFDPKKIQPQKDFGSQKSVGPENILVPNFFLSRTNFGPEQILTQKNFNPKKVLVPKILGLVGLGWVWLGWPVQGWVRLVAYDGHVG